MKAILNAFCCVFLVLNAAAAQEGKVVVVNSESKDLKRTAYRMRLPVERLRNAREALQEATDLAKRLRPVQVASFASLGNNWVLLYRPKAELSIKGLASTLHYVAQDAHDSREYTDATSAVRSLLTALAQLDPEEALQLARQWPEPSESLGKAAQRVKADMETQFRVGAAQRIAYSNPQAALKLWSGIEGTGNASLGARAQIADSLSRAGRMDQAVELLDQAISDLGNARSNDIGLNEAMQVVQTVSRIAPDRFPEAFRLLTESAASLPAGGSPSLKLGEQVITLDNAEAVALNLLADIQQRPALVMKAIDTMPNLKSKLEAVGGIDSVLTGGPVEISYGDQGELQTRTFYGPDASYGDQSLFSELRGISSKNPGLVRDRLAGLDPSQEQIQNLLNLASTSALEDPDLSSIALETARKLILRMEPVSSKAMMFAQLLRTSRRCDGEVNPEILKQGFRLVTEIREEGKDQPENVVRGSGPSAAYRLERALISEMAIDNFGEAMRYVHAMQDEQLQLPTLLAIIDLCRRPF